MNNKYETDIDVPESYMPKKSLPKGTNEGNEIEEIPNSINKVKRKTIRGVIKSDNSQD